MKIFSRGDNLTDSDLRDSYHMKKIVEALRDQESKLNLQYYSSEIYYHFRLFYTIYVLLYSLIKIVVPAVNNQLIQDYDFKFRLFTIPFLIIIEAIWSEKAVKKFYDSFPITWILQLLIHGVSFIETPKIDLLILFFAGGTK